MSGFSVYAHEWLLYPRVLSYLVELYGNIKETHLHNLFYLTSSFNNAEKITSSL